MAQVIGFFSRKRLDAAFKEESDFSEGQLFEYDPKMPIALELFVGLDQSALLENCWVPLSWDEKGIVVLVDDTIDEEKRSAIKAALKTDWVIFATGVKEDIEAFINRSFSQREIYKFFTKMLSGKEPVDVIRLVDIVIREAFDRGVSNICFEASAVSGAYRILFWMDGLYREYMTVQVAVAFDVVKRIKSMANLDVEDRQLAKVGYMIFENEDIMEIKIAVTIYPIDGQWEDIILNIQNN